MLGKTNSNVIQQSVNLQTKTGIEPSLSSQTITPDVGYDGLDSVQINAMPSGSATTPATTISASPSISLNSSTGEVVASVSSSSNITPTVVAGYVAAGTPGTVNVSGSNTKQLSTKSAQTYYVSSSDRTITSGQYLTGTQTIKAVVTSGITASNVKKGAVISVGDSTKSDRIISVTGTYEPVLETVSDTITTNTTTTYTPSAGYDGIGEIEITTNVPTSVNLQAKSNISPLTSSQTITADVGYDGLSSVQINAMPSGSATTPDTTITANPSINVSSGGLITASASASQSITPTVNAGYVSSGTAGTVSVSGSNTQQLTTQAAQTIYPSTTDQTISSGRFLTGNQTIKAVTTTNILAENIKSGVTVEVGDDDDPDRVLSVLGTYSGSSYTLLGTTSITTSSTSTSATSVGTLDLGATALTSDKILYVRIRGERGKQIGYFYGTDSYLFNANAGASSTFIHAIRRYGTTYSQPGWQTNIYAGTNANGIFPYQITSAGVLQIYRKYNNSASGTINDTFTIQAYLLNTPDGVSPFA